VRITPSATTVIQLTKRTEYGLIALVHLADAALTGRDGAFVSVREIAEHYPVPKRLLAEVLKDLARAELVESARGKDGGYTLRRQPDQITLAEVVAALEGRPSISSCETAERSPSSSNCGLEPVCPIRSPLHRVREGIWGLMERTTLRSLAQTSSLVQAGPLLQPKALT
jgi:Rrf2 family protein